jgi:hypothetical protein
MTESLGLIDGRLIPPATNAAIRISHDHYHSGLNLLTPAVVHYGQAEAVRQQRQAVLGAAYAQFPQRFVRGEPLVKGAPDAVWINPPVVPNLP